MNTPTNLAVIMLPQKLSALHLVAVTMPAPIPSRETTRSSKYKTATWSPLQKAAAAALDSVERLFIAPMETAQGPLPPTVDPARQLAGNFRPVGNETPPTSLIQVDGAVPAGLGPGVYVRNGANPHLPPRGGHHLFDGDGMLHAVSFAVDGAAKYASRFTRTYRYEVESALGRPIFPKPIGELHGKISGPARLLVYYARCVLGLLDMKRGMGVANAAVLFFNGKLLAMSEDDLPYAVELTGSGDLKTIGRHNFEGQLSPSTATMIAHPTLDPRTGELMALSCNVVKKPYLKYIRFSADGKSHVEVALTVDRPVVVHDFAVTENFVVVPDQQVLFDLRKIFRGESPVYHDPGKRCRFGILPRNDEDESRLQWITVPDCFCLHLCNAWEDGDEIVVVGSCLTPADGIFNCLQEEALTCVLSEIRLCRNSGTSAVRPIVPDLNLEMGNVNKDLIGRKTKYAYMAIAEPWPKVSGIAKVDLSSQDAETAIVGKFMYAEGCYGGEPLFVPRLKTTGEPGTTNEEEDDGYVLSFVHNEISDESFFLILDAASPSLQTLASIKLPCRVPYGFHGTFVRQ